MAVAVLLLVPQFVLPLVGPPGALHAQWLEPPGHGWVDLTVYRQDTDEAFGSDGEVRPFFADGRAVSTSVFVTAVAGVVDGLDAWIQMPYHRLTYDDIQDDRLRTGIGDTRFYLRTAPLRFLGSDLPFAIRAGVKVPVSDFEVDAEVIPLGDGQRDWEVMAELGHSFYPFPGYVSGWAGYRWREPNEATFREFGDEAFFVVQGGVDSGRWSLGLVGEGARTASEPSVAGLPFSNLERSVLTLHPSAGVGLGPGVLTLGARFSLVGRNLPAGHALVLGYFTRWAL